MTSTVAASDSFVTLALHEISQGLTYPVIVILLLLIIFAVFVIGTIIAEACGERRNFKVNTPQLLQDLQSAPVESLTDIIQNSKLLKRQKKVLFTILENANLYDESLYALAKRLVRQESDYYQRVVDFTDTAAKISPMFGLMGTLIPLGPGIVALSSGDTQTLSSALSIAFDTTVAGLIVAAVCLVISRIRKRWYASYMTTLEAATTSLLEDIAAARDDGWDGTMDNLAPENHFAGEEA